MVFEKFDEKWEVSMGHPRTECMFKNVSSRLKTLPNNRVLWFR